MENTDVRSAPENETEQIDLFVMLKDMLRFLKKYWWLFMLLCAAGGGAMLFRQYRCYVPIYRSQASFTVSMGREEDGGYDYMFYYDRSTASQISSTFPYLISSEMLTDLVKLDLDAEYINGSITASAVENSNLITLAVTSSDKEDAKNILDSVIRNFPTVSRYVIGETSLNMIEASSVPDEPINGMGRKRALILGVGAGAMIWLIAAFLYAFFRRTIKSESQIKPRLNAACICTFPHVTFKKRKSTSEQEILITNKRISSAFSESVKKAAIRISKKMADTDAKTVVLTAAASGEGNSAVAANIALAFGEMGKKVLLVRQLSEAQDSFAVSMNDTWTKKNEDCKIKEYGKINLASVPDRFLTVKLNGKEMPYKEWIEKTAKDFDCIIVDAGAGNRMSSAANAVQAADAFAVVIKQDSQSDVKLRDFISELREYDTECFGCILNDADSGLFGYGYGYGYGYGRYGHYGKYGGYGKYGKYGYGYGYGESRKEEKESD